MSNRQQNLTTGVIAIVPILGWINHPTTLIGIGGAEVYGHAWSWWWRTQHWPMLEQGTHLAVGVESFPAIDFLPLMLLGWIARWFSPLAAHNIWVILCCALAAYGGKKLAESVNGNPLFGAMAVVMVSALFGQHILRADRGHGIGFERLGSGSCTAKPDARRLLDRRSSSGRSRARLAHRSIAARLHAAASTSLEAEIQRRWNPRRWKCSAAVAALEALERIGAPIR